MLVPPKQGLTGKARLLRRNLGKVGLQRIPFYMAKTMIVSVTVPAKRFCPLAARPRAYLRCMPVWLLGDLRAAKLLLTDIL